MNEEPNVRYVDLANKTVTSVLGFGTEPPDEAARMLNTFMHKRSFAHASKAHPSYGFSNPNPSPKSSEYSYKLWCRIDPETKPAPPVKIKQIPGARYAVTQFTGLSNIGRVWKQCAAWAEHRHGNTPSGAF